MAYGRGLLLSAAVLLAVLHAGAATVDPAACAPGLALPAFPVPSCRMYAVSRTCGLGGPYGPRDASAVLRERCCRELAAVRRTCRCVALGFMMDGEPGRLQDLPGCSRDTQRSFAATLTRESECNLPTVDGGMCYSLAGGDRAMAQY
ncbi:hypothetical protein ACP4OV_031144 [Aristida adscensionis]